MARHEPNRAPMTAFVTYADASKPILLRRLGWDVANDVQDDYTDIISRDNGKTWGEDRKAPSAEPAEGGRIVHTEHVALHVPGRNLLIQWTNDKLEPEMTVGYDMDQTAKIRITVAPSEDFVRGNVPPTLISEFGIKQGVYVSFATAMLDSRGRVLVPVMWQKNLCPIPKRPLQNASAERIGVRGFKTRKDMPDVFSDVWEVGLLIGEFVKPTGSEMHWHVSQPVPFDLGQSSRGLAEGAVAEVADGSGNGTGRLFMIIRGSNEGWPDMSGYKWLSHSDDGGETWSPIVPLPCSDGTVIESSSTGSGLFRSRTNGKLYWMGNLCLNGQRARGNMPRSPLYIAEVQESPFVALKRDTITIIDQAQPGEHPETQCSNFKFYQDRETGDVVLFLTRYSERGVDDGKWMLADAYQYRVQMPG